MIFMLDSLVIVLMMFMGLRDDRRPPGEPHTSLFRMRTDAADASPPQAASPDAAPAWAEWLTETRPPR